MIARLRGTVLEAYPNRLVVEAGGVGYEVHVPVSTFDRLHPVEGSPVDLRTHLHIRETAHTLYGFATEEERDLFLLLIDRVSGIGPAIAMAILSGMPAGRFKACVAGGESAELSKIKGLGKKTAERIVLELRDRMSQLVAPPAHEAAAVASPEDRLRKDLTSALQNLGYHRPYAEKAVDATLASTPDSTFEQALKAALRELMR